MGTEARTWDRPRRRWDREEGLPLVRSKFARILELSEQKDVLDVGCVGGENGVNVTQTAYAELARVARSCVGLDVNVPEIERWQGLGYSVLLGDAEDFTVGQRFDVVVASDLIEHLSNPGRFLDRVREHLKDSGRLCIVTPNALSLNSAFKTLLGLRVRVNPEHTCWHDRNTLRQLLDRHGFEIAEEYWQDYQAHPLAALLVAWRRNLAAHIIVIARVKSSEESDESRK